MPSNIHGRSAISYFRYSSSQQGSGSSIERQQATLERVVSYYGLSVDDTLIDRALSASKGHHRTRGLLGNLLTSIKAGTIARGTVLIIEAIDRLTREDFFKAVDLIKDLIHGGMILVTGDMTIWDEEALNSPMIHKLIAEIQAAKRYTDLHGDRVSGAHAARRAKLEALASDPSATKPILNSRPPRWIIRNKGEREYRLDPDAVKTVQDIFAMCVEGYSMMQIASHLNRRGVPLMGIPRGNGTEWRACTIGDLLRNEAVLGYVQSRKRDGTRKVPVGRPVLLYPPAIDAATWVKARDILDSRWTHLRGRRGKAFPNLFTKHVFCKSCGGPMRVDTSGRKAKNRRQLICAQFEESKTCTDNTRYNLHFYEYPILQILTQQAAPKTASMDTRDLSDRLASLRLEISDLEKSMAVLAPRIGSSPTMADQFERIAKTVDGKYKQVADLDIKLKAAAVPDTRAHEVWQFLKALVAPAMLGDLDSRERLRAMLSRLDYTIRGEIDGPGLVVSTGGVDHVIRREAEPNQIRLLKQHIDGTDRVAASTAFGIAAAPFMNSLTIQNEISS